MLKAVFTLRGADRASDRAVQFMCEAFTCAKLRLQVSKILILLRTLKPDPIHDATIHQAERIFEM